MKSQVVQHRCPKYPDCTNNQVLTFFGGVPSHGFANDDSSAPQCFFNRFWYYHDTIRLQKTLENHRCSQFFLCFLYQFFSLSECFIVFRGIIVYHSLSDSVLLQIRCQPKIITYNLGVITPQFAAQQVFQCFAHTKSICSSSLRMLPRSQTHLFHI